jgi:hypothetical protein
VFSDVLGNDELDNVGKLKDIQRQAIKDLDFRLAAELQRKIDLCPNESAEIEFARIKTEMVNNLQEKAKQCLERRVSMTKQWHHEEIVLRRTVNDAFEKMKSMHLDALSELRQNLGQTHEEQIGRPYEKFNVLIARAKDLAKRGEFTLAEDLQVEANKAKEEEKERRETAFRETYDVRMTRLLAKEKSELQRLAIDSQGEISMFEKKRSLDFQKLNRDFGQCFAREYKKAVDSVIKARAGRKDQQSGCFPWRDIPALLNSLEDEYLSVLDKYGLQGLSGVKREPLILSPAKADRMLSPRTLSRMEFRGTSRKRKDGESGSEWTNKANTSPRPASRSETRRSDNL